MTVEIDTTTRPPLCLGKMAQPQPLSNSTALNGPTGPTVADLLRRIDLIEKELNTADEDVDRLRGYCTEYEDEITDLKYEVTVLKDENKRLETENKTLTLDVKTLTSDINDHTDELDDLRDRNDDLEECNDDLKRELDRIRTCITNMVLTGYGPPPSYEDTASQ